MGAEQKSGQAATQLKLPIPPEATPPPKLERTLAEVLKTVPQRPPSRLIPITGRIVVKPIPQDEQERLKRIEEAEEERRKQHSP